MSSPEIHTGFWIDYSQGRILGSVVTYKANYGNQLITAAALLVTITGSALWTIAAFFIHQHICREPNQDEVDAQIRVVIKNDSPPGAVSTLLNMGQTWNGRAKGAWKRTILFMLPPLFIFLSFTVAGIVVSYIALDPNNSPALIKQGYCAMVDENTQAVAVQTLSNLTIVSSAYVRDCYSGASTGAVACTTFNKPTLSYSVARNGSCPLGKGNCANGDNQAVNLTTFLDSHDDLGINANIADRIQTAYSVSCAPMSFDLLNSFTNTTHQYNIDFNGSSFTYSSVSFAHNSTSFDYTNLSRWRPLDSGAYTLYPYKSYWPHQNLTGEGFAIPPLNQTNRDVTLAWINTNGIRFLDQSNDPIFATTMQNRTVSNGYAFYSLKHQVSTIVCTDARKFCNGVSHCTDWIPLFGFAKNLSDTNWINELSQSLGFNGAQNATLFRLFYGGIDAASIYLSTLSPAPLRAADNLLGGFPVSKALPDDQWATEVETWFQISLAKLQYLAKLFPSVPTSIQQGSGYLLRTPSPGPMADQCSQQRIQIPSGYQNFSVFGLCFVFGVTVVALLAAYLLTQYHHKLPSRAQGESKHDKLLSYQADSYMQLHRAAMELAGHGGWLGGHDGKTEVPYTNRAERVLTRETLLYRSGTGGSMGNDAPNGNTLADPKVIAGSWNGTGITTIQ